MSAKCSLSSASPSHVIDDAVAADEGDTAVEHDELAMVAFVHHADVADVPVMELHDLAAGLFICRSAAFPIFFAADGIEQHPHLNAGAGPLRQRVCDALPEHAFLPQEGLEMNRLLWPPPISSTRTSKYAPFSKISTRCRRQPC